MALSVLSESRVDFLASLNGYDSHVVDVVICINKVGCHRLLESPQFESPSLLCISAFHTTLSFCTPEEGPKSQNVYVLLITSLAPTQSSKLLHG